MPPRRPVYSQPQFVEPPPRATLVEFSGASFTPNDIARAERAVAAVLSHYPSLMGDQIAKLQAAWAAGRASFDAETAAPVFKVAHDIAGYGETFGYPLVTVLGRSLCRLLTKGDLGRKEMATVVEAHIDALHIVVRDQIQGHGGAVGLALATELDAAIAKFSLAAEDDRPGRLAEDIRALQANS